MSELIFAVSMSEHVEEMIPKQRMRHQTFSEESQRKRYIVLATLPKVVKSFLHPVSQKGT